MLTKKQIQSKGFKVSFTNGTGAGGQKRNRTYSVALVEHIDTKSIERCDLSRSATKNMNTAYNKLVDKLKDIAKSNQSEALNDKRKEVLNKGVVRTYDFKRGVVKNHITKHEAPLQKVLNGDIELINKPI